MGQSTQVSCEQPGQELILVCHNAGLLSLWTSASQRTTSPSMGKDLPALRCHGHPQLAGSGTGADGAEVAVGLPSPPAPAPTGLPRSDVCRGALHQPRSGRCSLWAVLFTFWGRFFACSPAPRRTPLLWPPSESAPSCFSPGLRINLFWRCHSG